MQKENIVEARRYGDNFIALNDIVEISVKYIADTELRTELKGMNSVKGRVVYFGDNYVRLDCSSKYVAKTLNIPHDVILTVKEQVEEQKTVVEEALVWPE